MPRKKKTQEQTNQNEQPEMVEQPEQPEQVEQTVRVKNTTKHVTNVGGICFKAGEEVDISKIGEGHADYSRLQYAIKIGVLVKV